MYQRKYPGPWSEEWPQEVCIWFHLGEQPLRSSTGTKARSETVNLYTAGGKVNWCSCFTKQFGNLLSDWTRVTIWSSNSTLRYIPNIIENICPHKNLYMNIHSNLIIAQKWKQSKCASTDEWINKMWHINTMKYYPARRSKEVLIHSTSWMNLENITLTKRSQTEKDTYYMIPFTWNVQNRQIHKHRKQISDYQGPRERENEEQLFNGYRVSFKGDENFCN